MEFLIEWVFEVVCLLVYYVLLLFKIFREFFYWVFFCDMSYNDDIDFVDMVILGNLDFDVLK